MRDPERDLTAQPNPRARSYVARLPAGGFTFDGRWIPPTQTDIDNWINDDEDND